MFTGLVETTAELGSVRRQGPQARLRFQVVLEALELGESISCSGVCLTVAAFDAAWFEVDVSAETLAVTTIGKLQAGERVNIERSCRLGERLGGHLVLGHVDGVGRISELEAVGDARRMVVDAPPALARLFAPKGSVCVDGVSLTINRLAGASGFEVMLVPHTLSVTTLGSHRAGGEVNLEADVLARYVARQLDHAGITQAAGEERLMDALRRGGFLD